MSNLKLPAMNYANLMGIARKHNGAWKKIAYQTWVKSDQLGTTVFVKHHETVIAKLNGHSIRLTNGGYDSITTANRMDAVMQANAAYDYRVVFRGGLICVTGPADKPVPLYSGGETFTAKNLSA